MIVSYYDKTWNFRTEVSDKNTNVKFKTNPLVAAAREIGLDVSADKTNHMVISRDQNAGRIHSVRVDNSTFERVEGFK